MNLQGFNFEKAMQDMQTKQTEMQRTLENERVEATVGGGMVTVVMNGLKHTIAVKLDPEIINKEEKEMLQDLLVAAFNEAARKADDIAQLQLSQQMRGMMSGLDLTNLKIPGL